MPPEPISGLSDHEREPMKLKTALLLSILIACAAAAAYAQVTPARSPIRIPDIPGYKTLKCDFHVHTVFSDGEVWPSIRSEEAWREGLDAIAITDHLEYQPHKDDLPTNHERSYEIARSRGDELGVIVIKGSEVTRKMPPGHLNAIFLKSSKPLDVDDWRAAIRSALDQGAFIFWNHPGWAGQQADGVSRWYAEHTELVEKNLIQGVEVANDQDYYPDVHRWCIEKKLTMLSNSDLHDPIDQTWEIGTGDHRPFTLVFASGRSPEAIREALLARRTAVCFKHMLIGNREFLEPIFKGSVEVLNRSVTIRGKRTAYVQISNSSDVDYQLVGGDKFDEVSVPRRLLLKAGKTVLLPVSGKSETLRGKKSLELHYSVTNLKVTPDTGLDIVLPVEVMLVPTK